MHTPYGCRVLRRHNALSWFEGAARDRGGPPPVGNPSETLISGPPFASLMSNASPRPLVGVIMGSKSDWPTMQQATHMLDLLGVPFEAKVVSAHRTPDLLFEYAKSAAGRGLQVIIAGAGGAAHLPGMAASQTPLPVLGVPVKSRALNGMDSLLSIVQMPKGVPVGTFAIGDAGAANAGLFAASIVALHDPAVRKRLDDFRANQTRDVLENHTLEDTPE